MATDPLNARLDGKGDEMVMKWKQKTTSLDNEYASFQPLHRDIRDFLGPRTARFKGEKINDATRQDLNIINTSPRSAVRILGAGMQSGVTSPLRPWFRLGTPDPDLQQNQAVKEWLFDVENILRQILSRSNIYDRLKSMYVTEGLYGTACMFIDEDQDDVIRAHDFATGTFRLATSAAGRSNCMVRDVAFTPSQAMEKFKDRCPAATKLAYEQKSYDFSLWVTHIVEQNPLWKPGSALAIHKPFVSVWLDNSQSGSAAILKYEGYDYMPMFGPRWDVMGENTYGSGCGEYALGDGKQLQLMEKRSLQMLDQVARPTMVADASLRNQRLTNLPGETTYVNGLVTGNQGYRPAYQITNPPIDMVDAKAARVEMRIDEAFYKNLFLLVTEIADQPNITATQINTMREEKLLMLGPVLERLNDELLDPLIDTVFHIANARGMLPEPPEEIQGMPLRVEYISVLAQAQKALGIGNIERFIGFVGNMAAIWPGAANKVDVNELIDEYGDGIAIPPRLIRTNDAVAELEAQQQQKNQMAEMAAMAGPAAGAVKDLSEADMEGDSALTRAMGAVGV